MENFLLYLKESWILLGVTIIIFGTIISFIKWRRKMRIEKICRKIINDFNAKDDRFKVINKSELRPMLMKEYKLGDKKAWQCIEYLKEKGFLYGAPNMLTFWWIKQ